MVYSITVGGSHRVLSTDGGPRKCPFCGTHNIRRSRNMDVFDRLFSRLILMRPFRCLACEERFYGFFFRRFLPANDAARQQRESD